MKILKFLIVALAALSFGCGKVSSSPSKKPIVLVSISPYKFFVEKIGKDEVEIAVITPLNADPHVFEPTAKQMAEFSQAAIWFRMGESFEEKIANVFKDKVITYELHNTSDKHFWVSPKAALQQAEKIEEILSKQFSEKSEKFKKNLAEFKEELKALDQEIFSILEPVQNRVLLVSHPAFSSFCRDYGIEEFSLEEEGKEIRPKHVEKIFKKAQNASFALALPQHNNKGIERIAEHLHLPVLSINPYSENYFEMIRTLAHYLADDYE